MLRIINGLTPKGRKAVYLSSVWLAIFELICIIPLFMIVDVFNKLYEKYTSKAGTDIEVYAYVLIGTILIICMFFSYKKMYKAKYISAADENMNLRMSVMDKLRKLPESYLSKHDLSDLTSTIMDDVGTIEGILANQLTEMIGGFLFVAVVIIVMLFYNVKMTLCMCVVLPVAAVAMGLSDTVSGKTHLKNRNYRVSISDSIQEYLENIKVLKASGSIEGYQKKLERKIKRLIPRLILFEFLSGMCVTIAYNVLRVGIGIVVVYGAGLLAEGEINLSTFITYVLLVVWIYEPLSYTCEHLGAVIASKVASGRIDEIKNCETQQGDKDINVENYDIMFDNVSFGYNDEKILNDVSFTAHQGEYTALVGASGSGKSTICKLAARLWDTDKGKITLGGVDISRVDPEKLLGLYSMVFQDVTLFNDTIYNNILIGNKNATKEQVLKAARDAQCMSFIDKLPDGIYTVIGENGHTLSGGERQRLSIARAFLKDAPIVLLDESTASVDPETETKIQEAIERLTRGRTVLMIAHRLRSVVDCDRIVVLNEGKVVGDSTHDELMKSCELYKRLYTLQGTEE